MYWARAGMTWRKALAAASQEIGAPVEVADFVRFDLGEGIE